MVINIVSDTDYTPSQDAALGVEKERVPKSRYVPPHLRGKHQEPRDPNERSQFYNQDRESGGDGRGKVYDIWTITSDAFIVEVSHQDTDLQGIATGTTTVATTEATATETTIAGPTTTVGATETKATAVGKNLKAETDGEEVVTAVIDVVEATVAMEVMAAAAEEAEAEPATVTTGPFLCPGASDSRTSSLVVATARPASTLIVMKTFRSRPQALMCPLALKT